METALNMQEFGMFGLMAVCGGLMGALFNCLNKYLRQSKCHVGTFGQGKLGQLLFWDICIHIHLIYVQD